MVVDRLAAATAQYSNQVQSKSGNVSTAAKGTHAVPAKQTAEDTTSFTSSTSSVKALSKTALQTTPTRQAKVEALRQAVKTAQYQYDSARIAQSIASSDI